MEQFGMQPPSSATFTKTYTDQVKDLQRQNGSVDKILGTTEISALNVKAE